MKAIETLVTEIRKYGPHPLRALLRVLLRTLRAHLRLPPRAASPPDDLRVVVTLTTIPSRAQHLGPVLRALRDQTVAAHEIWLWFPRQSTRQERPYTPPPDVENVHVFPCDDLGPATKLLYALRRATPDTLLIIVDDDVVHPARFIEEMVAAARRWPDAALCCRGRRLDPQDPGADSSHVFGPAVQTFTPVDILMGTWGFCVRPSFFDEAVHSMEGYPESLRWTDDVRFSGHLARRGVARGVVPFSSPPLETPNNWRDALSHTLNHGHDNDRRSVEAFGSAWDLESQ